MNAVLLHLSFSHFVVALPIISIAFFVVAAIKNRSGLYQVGVALLILAAVAVIPQYLTGDAAEEAAEHDAVAHEYMETHEEIAEITLWMFVGSGILALAALGWGRSEKVWRKWNILLLLLAVVSSVLVGLTAHQGGMIRHPAIRDAAAPIPSSLEGKEEGHEYEHEDDEHEHEHEH